MEEPLYVWVPSVGVSGMMLYTGDKFPDWRGSLFNGGLSGESVTRLTLGEEGSEIMNAETLVQRMGRVRDIRQGPDGYIYVAIDGEEGEDLTPIYRLEPAE